MDPAAVEDIAVETDEQSISVIAHEIAKRSGWLTPVYG